MSTIVFLDAQPFLKPYRTITLFDNAHMPSKSFFILCSKSYAYIFSSIHMHISKYASNNKNTVHL